MNNGVMTMRALDKGLPIEPGKTVKLAPGGYHLMLMDLKTPLKQGDKVPLTLEFEKAGKVTLLPHMGSATIEGRIDMGEKVIINIKTFMDGHKPPDRVLPSML